MTTHAPSDAPPPNGIQESSDLRLIPKSPMVSVLMITYNHANYLAEAIEGVLNQKCTFSFELIIGEDASCDATRNIALKYQKAHPNIIRVIYSQNNVGMNINSRRILERANGKYIAYCEGDDYWCNSEKLQRQVAQMESDAEIGIVHSDWTRTFSKSGQWAPELQKSAHQRVPLKHLTGYIFETWHRPRILRTCTIMLRKSSMIEWYASGLMDEKYHFGDSVLSAWITERSKVGYDPTITAVYRVSPNSALRSGIKARIALYDSALQFDTAARAFFTARGRTDYPEGYRWDSAVSMLLWGLRGRAPEAIGKALVDIKRHFSLGSFLTTGGKNIILRLPTLRCQRRRHPDSKT